MAVIRCNRDPHHFRGYRKWGIESVRQRTVSRNTLRGGSCDTSNIGYNVM